ncbi:unnamed protein product [Triticum turgidum subsp. durum]|uniref:F-box associated beta-propeller type 3 domain-containing protein n=1 Tax=Triticum turgidum subsp. durum TaxID=4567 RepID=A0A9R0YGE7_TRITD|nr:unnamed protein product [Triticum turgidum subsp. durum]
MDMDGNVVKVLKGIDGSPLISTSSHDLICVANYSYSYANAQVIDPASGKVLMDCPKQQRTEVCTFFCSGRSAPSLTYKVVKVDDGSACKVFTLGEDTGWRVSEPPKTSISYMENSPVTVNSVMYFLETQHRRGYTLHSFDIESETWKKTISGSRKPMGPDVCLAVLMAELNGALCMVQTERDHTPMTNNRCANIWILADLDMGTWIKAYTIPMDASTDYCRPLRVTHGGGKLIFCNTFYAERQEIRAYNLHTEACTSLCKLDRTMGRIALCNLQLDRLLSQPRFSVHRS